MARNLNKRRGRDSGSSVQSRPQRASGVSSHQNPQFFKSATKGKFEKTEREGFEPSIPCGMHAFQACALGHYATSPFFKFYTKLI